MRFHEAHVERMLGQRVRDPSGRVIGRLEELHVAVIDGEHVVTEYHVGSGAAIERIAGFLRQLPFLRALPRIGREWRISWELFDLSDPTDLRTRVAEADLPRTRADKSG